MAPKQAFKSCQHFSRSFILCYTIHIKFTTLYLQYKIYIVYKYLFTELFDNDYFILIRIWQV